MSDSKSDFQHGDRVRIRPEWGGDDAIFVVREWNGDRGYISPVEWEHGKVVPQELVRAEMIEQATEQFSAKLRETRSTRHHGTESERTQDNAR